MRFVARMAPSILLGLAAGCSSERIVCCTPGQAAVRVVNAYTTPVDVLVDGKLIIGSLAAGTTAMAVTMPGDHTIALQPTGSATSVSRSITTANGATGTIAAVRASTGALSSVALDDTNGVVPPGATKVRVLHLAPNAGTLQVYRTQPDYPHAVQWQFPFDYQPDPTSLSAPFYQSTVGS